MKIRTKTSDDGTLRAEHRVVLITGILGQLGQYLAFFLLSTGYCHAVIGLGLGSDRANLTSNILLPQLRKFIKSGESAVVVLAPEKPLVLEKFSDIPQLGRFAIRDSGRTVAVGVVQDILETVTKEKEKDKKAAPKAKEKDKKAAPKAKAKK